MQIKPLAAPAAGLPPPHAASPAPAASSDASFARHLESRRAETAAAKTPAPKRRAV
jgi:hypothetical protein